MTVISQSREEAMRYMLGWTMFCMLVTIISMYLVKVISIIALQYLFTTNIELTYGLPADDEIAATSPYRYPIVPSFQDWKFPSTLPEAWTRPYYTDRACYTAPQSTLTAAIRARDMTCRITTHFTATGVAHLCPEHEQEWFLRNSMQSWNSDLTLDPDNLLNDLSNAILLRPDLHAAFDDRKFVFFPKSEDGFVVHMLEPTPDLAQLYHNVRLQPLWQCNAQFLYARFAWAIFPSLSGFLSKPNAAPLVLVVKSNGGHTEWVEEESVTSEKLRARVSASRSQSLKKRQPAADKDSLGSVDDDGAYLGRKRQRTVVPAEKVVHTVSGTYDNGSQEQAGSWVAGRHETTETSYEDKTLAEMELEEDQNMLCVSLQDLKDHQKPVSWYPGWRRVQRLKDRWLEQTRPLGYEPAKTTRHISFRSGKKVDRACCVTDIFTSAGFEVMDTFSEEGE